MTEPLVKPERPGLFIAAILFHVFEGFCTVVLGTFGVMGLAFAAAIVAASAESDDACVAIIALVGTMAFVAIFIGLGLITLYLAYRAWSMERLWVIALIVYSVLSLVLEPCGILVTVLTVIGGLQALDVIKRGAPPTV